MRIPPNLGYFLLFLVLAGLAILGVHYVPLLIPNIGTILMWALFAFIGVMMFFTFVKPMFTFLYARADGIFAVYMDKSKEGFHVFSYYINTSPEFGSGTRDLQHYFILLRNGKIFYKEIYSHRMEPQSGRSGWEGFNSFEASVLPSPQLVRTLGKLSGKAGMPLQLGEEIKQAGDDHFVFDTSTQHIELKKFSGAVDEGIKVICTDKATGNIIWKRKI